MLPSVKVATEYPLQKYIFSQPQVAASQTGVALKTVTTPATSGSLNIVGVPMPFAGNVVGVGASLTTTATTGTISVTPTINTTALAAGTGLAAVAITTKSAYKTVSARTIGAHFNAGDILGCNITTGGTYAPTTSDLQVDVYVVFEGVQL
jgi:hypothetical protein